MNKIIFLVLPFICFLCIISGSFSSYHEKTYANEAYQKSFAAGEKVYKKYCISCHQADGGGVPNMTPPLISSSYVNGNKQALISIILNGLKNVPIDEENYANPMPALGNVLKDQQIADVLSFIRNNFENKASVVTVSEVKSARQKNKK